MQEDGSFLPRIRNKVRRAHLLNINNTPERNMLSLMLKVKSQSKSPKESTKKLFILLK